MSEAPGAACEIQSAVEPARSAVAAAAARRPAARLMAPAPLSSYQTPDEAQASAAAMAPAIDAWASVSAACAAMRAFPAE